MQIIPHQSFKNRLSRAQAPSARRHQLNAEEVSRILFNTNRDVPTNPPPPIVLASRGCLTLIGILLGERNNPNFDKKRDAERG